MPACTATGRTQLGFEPTRRSLSRELGVLAVVVVTSAACAPNSRAPSTPTLEWRFLDPALSCDDDGNVYIAAAEQFATHSQIFVATSNRYAETWNSQFHYVNTSRTGDRGRPLLATGSSGEVFVMWEDTRDGGVDLFFNRSLDGGRSWLDADVQVNTGALPSRRARYPALRGDDHGNLYALWRDDREGFDAFYLAHSGNRGESWTTSSARIHRLDPGRKSAPTLGLDEHGNLYVTWVQIDVGAPTVYFNTSANQGSTWLYEETRIGGGGGVAQTSIPQLCALRSGVVVVTWLEIRNGRADVRLARSPDRGQIWDPGPRTLAASGGPYFNPSAPQIACDELGHVYVGWQVQSADAGAIFVLQSSTDGGRSFSETRFPATGVGRAPEIDLFAEPRATPFRMVADESGNVYFAWITGVSGAASVGFDRVSDHGRTWLGLPRSVGVAGHAPYSPDAPLVCADNFGHVYLLWNEGTTLTAAMSPFYGDSGWRYEHF